ncbi:MAG: threonine/serine exporter family protein [Mycobacterium sp.]
MRSQWISEKLRKPVPAALAPPDSYDPADVGAMLREIGAALVETAEPVQAVEQRLLNIAARYTTQPVQVSALPTIMFIQIGRDAYEMDSFVQVSGQMNMAAETEAVAELAAAGAITPTAAVAAVRAARMMPPRFGALTTTLGYALTTVGFGMVIDPSWKGLLAHLFLGLVVGLLVQIARPFPNLTPILPTLSAVVVTLLATWFVADVAEDGLLRVISPALIAMLPGMALVIGSIELAGGRIISGASRTVYGIAQMGLLIYGVVLGVRIAGEVPPELSAATMGPWSVYASIVVIAAGLYIYLSAPKGSFVWLLITIAVATLAQTVAGQVLNTSHSGFIGAMVAIPFAVLSSQIKGAPPASVLTLAAFWTLVPGQLTFMSLGRHAAGDLVDTASMSVAAAAIVSIALGALVGWSLVRTVTGAPQRPVAMAVGG